MNPLLASLLIGTAHADTAYQSSLESLRLSQERLNRALGQPSPAQEHQRRSDEAESQPLLPIRAAMGKLVFAHLVNRLVVGADGSPTIIEVDPDQGALSGLRVFGQAWQAGAPGRVGVEFQRIRLSSGRSVAIQGVGLDAEGAFGLTAQVMGGKALAVGGSIASSFVSGLAASQQVPSSQMGFGLEPTGRNALLQGVAQSAADQSKRLIEEATGEKPVLVVEALTTVTLYFKEEARW